LLTYDYNQDVRDTMKQLWSSLVDVDKESQLIEEKWPEILDLCLDYMKQKEFRKRLSACLVLCDLIPNRSWTQIKSKFRELFLGSLNLLDDDVEAIKNAGVDLAKANKKIILKHANIYNNTNLEELREGISEMRNSDELIDLLSGADTDKNGTINYTGIKYLLNLSLCKIKTLFIS
jgi:hypothetical protein